MRKDRTSPKRRGDWVCRECKVVNGLEALACRRCEVPRPFKRGGLHKLECELCSAYTYSTVACLEAAGFPRCGREGCGGAFVPERIELATLLGIDGPWLDAVWARTDDKERSQLRKLGRNGVAERRWAGTLNDMSARALTELRVEQRQASRERRLNALMPVAEPMAF